MAAISIIVLAKYPRPGMVKTRMIPPLSTVQAAEVHRASLLAVIEKLTRLRGFEITLAVTPDDRVEAMAGLVSEFPVKCQPQGGGDLGARLARLSAHAFAAGADGVLLLGADSPTLPAEFLLQAVAHLARGEAVLGPCDDGGYYLLGLPTPMPVLFERIAWGSSAVAEQTRARAAEAGIRLGELPLWYDLDQTDDLLCGLRDLARTTMAGGCRARELQELLTKLMRE